MYEPIDTHKCTIMQYNSPVTETHNVVCCALFWYNTAAATDTDLCVDVFGVYQAVTAASTDTRFVFTATIWNRVRHVEVFVAPPISVVTAPTATVLYKEITTQ